jgi:hypothetical protein
MSEYTVLPVCKKIIHGTDYNVCSFRLKSLEVHLRWNLMSVKLLKKTSHKQLVVICLFLLMNTLHLFVALVNTDFNQLSLHD